MTIHQQISAFEHSLQARYRINSIRGIVRTAHQFIQWCDTQNIPYLTATYTELLNYIKLRTAKGHKKSTLNHNIGHLKHFYNYLIATQQCTENPALTLRIRNQTRTVVKDIINYEELEAIYTNFTAQTIVAKRDKAILGLIIYQALNTTEIEALTINDVKFEEAKIYIPSTNRSNDRIIKLEAVQIVQLQNYTLSVRPVLMEKYHNTTPKLFFSTGQSQYMINNFTKILAWIKSLHPSISSLKQLRASVIVHWYKQHNARQVQYQIGHRYISSTEPYRIDKLESLQEQLEKIHPIQ
jgi:site-specific recombinase XerD